MPDTHLTLKNAADAIASTVWAADAVLHAATPAQFAAAIRDLQEAASDLASWHPSYNSETGEIEVPDV
jgi:hypothetical protein